jgi:ABC-2 type transport system ATP-binding protein
VRHYLERYQQETGCAILLASHNMGEVERLANRVLMLRQGKLVDSGSPDDLLFRYSRQNLEEVFLDIARDRRAAGEVAPNGSDRGGSDRGGSNRDGSSRAEERA